MKALLGLLVFASPWIAFVLVIVRSPEYKIAHRHN